MEYALIAVYTFLQDMINLFFDLEVNGLVTVGSVVFAKFILGAMFFGIGILSKSKK